MSAFSDSSFASRFDLETSFTKKLKVRSRLGLHARPAALIVRALQPYKCAISASSQGETVNARSILGLLSLAARDGTEVHFMADGAAGPLALAALEKLFRAGFGENRGMPAARAILSGKHFN